jgi:putative phage-type endonuclease
MRIIECDQNTAQWLHERVGRITASRVGEALSKYKDAKKAGVDTAERYNYKIDLIAERLTGRSTENFMSPEMVWGRDHEEEASFAYEEQAKVMAVKVGFILHPRYDWSGASPDSLVGAHGGLEIKCPKTATHLKWMREGIVPEVHQDQVLWNMLCAEREWWDFASFDPRLPKGINLFTVRMHRDEGRLQKMEEDVVRFNEEVESIVAELRSKVTVPLRLTIEDEVAPPFDQWAERFEEAFGGDISQ